MSREPSAITGHSTAAAPDRWRLLEGKVALVTGASRGIGAATALAFASAGARVALAARDEQALAAAKGIAPPHSLSSPRRTLTGRWPSTPGECSCR